NTQIARADGFRHGVGPTMLTLGARYMLLVAFAFSLMTLFVKLAGQRLPAQEIVAVRAALTLLFSYLALRKARLPPLGSGQPLLWVRGLCGFLALSCVYYAVTHLPLAEATVLQYLHPPLTAVLASLVLGERLDRSVGISLALGLLGLILIAQPSVLFGTTSATLPPLALAAAVGGAVFSSCAYVIVRKLGTSEHPLVIVLYFPLVALPASIPGLLHEAVMPQGLEWLWLLAVGVSTQIGQVAITHALSLDAASRTAGYSYVQVPLAALWGALFFSAVPNLYSVLGATLILSGALINLRAHTPRSTTLPSPKRLSYALLIPFLAAATFHAAALVWPSLSEPVPAWRHALFIAINAALALGLWIRPPWFAAVFLLFTLQQLASHGASAWQIWHEQHRLDWASLVTMPFVAGVCVWLLHDAWQRRRLTAR
ncbi:MAG TPA: DMT family transporter, partial [Polyangiales bacterium]|nr:DMT family transporter [Polyangiales bacterium]